MKTRRGVSLIETMIAIALLAIIVVSILSAFSAITIAAARHKQSTTLDLLTRSDAEYIKSQAYSPGLPGPTVYTNLTAAGYEADIVGLDGDPLTDISAVTRVAFVMKGGKVYKTPPAPRQGSAPAR